MRPLRALRALAAVAVVAASFVASPGAGVASPTFIQFSCSPHSGANSSHQHSGTHGGTCKSKLLGSVEVSEAAGLGQFERHGKIGAVVQRDEGAVALLDLKKPNKPKVLGRYNPEPPDRLGASFDGGLAFSADGNWLFYARQTHQYGLDGIHVLDVSDPSAPRLTEYEPLGGTLRIAYHSDDSGEYVIAQDAIHGLVINRFISATGTIVPVFVDALPALKVGGPASAGLYVDPKDPKLGVPLLYSTNGTTGLQVFDLSDPTAPELLGEWTEAGLADVEVVASKKSRTVYVATEYWFDKSTPAEVIRLDASDLGAIEEKARLGFDLQSPLPNDNTWRIQGMAVSRGDLYVAHSHAGLVVWAGGTGPVSGAFMSSDASNPESDVPVGPYAMDVEVAGSIAYLTDASTGTLSVVRF